MTVSVERLQEEPIIVATFTGEILVEEVREMYQKSAALAEDIEGKVYRITDIREATADFPKMLEVVGFASKGEPGTTSDKRFFPMFVGTNELARLFTKAMEQREFGGVKMPFFVSMQDALTFVRNEMRGVEEHPTIDLDADDQAV